jgi:hypothetical protein
MPEVAAAAARAAGLGDTVKIRDGLFENLSVNDDSVDVVISNGVVNLAPDKRRCSAESPGSQARRAAAARRRDRAARAHARRARIPTSGRRASAARW